MNKIKKILPIILFSTMTLSLQSCSLLSVIFGGLVTSSISYIDASGAVSFKTPNYKSDYSVDNLTLKNIGLGYGYRYLPSTGNQKILVVPIAFEDSSFTSAQLSLIEKGFFGESDDTGWESVASFYQKSSYGKLNLSGEVTDPVQINKTVSAFEESASKMSAAADYTSNVLDSVLKTLQENNAVNLDDYDTDGDGYVDAVWMVYSAKAASSSDLWWAYTTWSDNNTSISGSKAKPCLYSWASIDFLTLKNYSTPLKRNTCADAHTFIHETGHMLGLDDYYSYDYEYSSTNREGNADSPVGGVDMMDFNVGDHCAFSKYLLGWTSPTVVTNEYLQANNYSLTLKSQTESGNFFLIPTYKDGSINYNGTVFDEYLIVEYYTDSNLNYLDSTSSYANGMSTYSKNGVLVYHVDATIGKIIADRNGGSWDGYAYDKLPAYSSNWGSSYLYAFLFSNTKSYSWEKSLDDTNTTFYRERLISLLPASGKKVEGAKTGWASNNSLYTKGKTFGSSGIYSDFIFDDGTSSPFGFSVNAVSDTDCQLTFAENK